MLNAAYGPLQFDVTSIPFPERGREQVTLDALELACRNEMPAAFIVEPPVLGAGGMLMYPAWVLREMKRICERSDVLFIADEIMTGWGRTGTLFACEQANVTPDIGCYAKGLTGGALPLAVTLCRADIFDAHCSTDRTRAFFHSSSYTANPIACAAAKANLDLWKDQDTCQRMASVATMQEPDARFANVPRTGTITALDLKTGDAGYLASRSEATNCLQRQEFVTAPARQYDLRDASLLRHGGRSRSGLCRDRGCSPSRGLRTGLRLCSRELLIGFGAITIVRTLR